MGVSTALTPEQNSSPSKTQSLSEPWSSHSPLFFQSADEYEKDGDGDDDDDDEDGDDDDDED